MSIWSCLNGNVRFHESLKISVKTVITEVFTDEHELAISSFRHPDGKIHVEFELTFCSDGESAIKQVTNFTTKLKELGAHSDLMAEIRFVN